MHANYQGSTHHAIDTSKLIWCIADKTHDLQLQKVVLNQEGQTIAKLIPDLHTEGREKFAVLSLATFNKKVQDMALGRAVLLEDDDLPAPDFGDEPDGEAYDETGEDIEFDN